MGVDSALRIANELGQRPPREWQQRRTDLDVLIKFRYVDQNSEWKADEIVSFWQEEVAQTGLPGWDAVVERWLANAPSGAAVTVDRVCDAALVWQGKPEKLALLAPLLKSIPLTPGPDVLEAARHFVAASVIFPSGR